eukprot:jgi/Picre1/32511/NNA_007857.t1
MVQSNWNHFLKSITVQSIESSVVHTDHAAVIVSLRCQTPITTPTKKAYRRRIPTQFRNDASILQNFRDECSQRFRPLARQDTITYKTWLDIKGTIARLSYSAQRKFRGKELEAVRQLREQEAAMSAFTSHQLQHRYAHVDHQPNAEQQWDADTESHAMPLTPYRYSTTDYRLQDSHQQLQGDSTACANILIDHYADISQQDILSEEIQEEILHSLTPADRTVFPAQAFPGMITEQDVRNAIKRMKPTAAGLDGIKIVTYRLLKDSLAPILAKVFTGLLHDMPQSFLEGLIIPIYKKGPRYQAINYRPITLLNTDYRIFTQILLAKLKGPLQQLISPTQTAFLPGRSPMDKVWPLQLIPQHLQLEQKSAFLAVCDFSKAYDKVDRRFLMKICQCLQMPPPLQHWIAVLLENTYSQVYYNGAFSKRRKFEAGVRQGDPVSPYLYLLIGHILARWLEKHRIGIRLPLTHKMQHYLHGGLQHSPTNSIFLHCNMQMTTRYH